MESEPARVAKILALAAKRRVHRGVKERVLRPRVRVPAEQSRKPTQYVRLPSGQIVGTPRLMREVKAEARQARLARRAERRSLATVV
jgi:hypothetical protein